VNNTARSGAELDHQIYPSPSLLRPGRLDRASMWIVAVRRRRKRLPPGGHADDEAEVLRALMDLDKATISLLRIGG